MKNESALFAPANAVNVARLQSAVFLILSLIAFGSIAGCTTEDANLSSKMSATYHTGFSSYATAGQMLSNK